jgi:hypothetical protein
MEIMKGTCRGNSDTGAGFSPSNKLIFPTNIYVRSPYSVTLSLRYFKGTMGQLMIIILVLNIDSAVIRAACTYQKK